MLRHVEHERLRGTLGGLAQRGDLTPGGLEIAEGDEGRRAPGHRLGADLGVAELLSEVPRLGQHVEDLLERAGPPRPVGAHQDRGEPGAVLEVSRHGDGARANDRSALVVALEVERAREAAQQPDP